MKKTEYIKLKYFGRLWTQNKKRLEIPKGLLMGEFFFDISVYEG